MTLGIISDTHGLLRPEALAALSGVDQILHAGDVGDADILDALRTIAPVTAIRGNVDNQGPCAELPADQWITLAATNLYMTHDLYALSLDPVASGIACIISGHSHQPAINHKKGVLYFNPGSAGPRRFALPVSLGFLDIEEGVLSPRLVTLV